MKRIKIVTSLVLAISIILSATVPGIAFERKEHDKYMAAVLFNHLKNPDFDTSIKPELDVLAAASYLTIDQFNGNGENDLSTLKEYGIKGLPKTVDEISFTASGKNHRNMTHRGWDNGLNALSEDAWTIRQNILRNTVDKMFDFKGDEKQKDAFCQLIYYTHILGDHADDKSYKISNGLKMDIGGRKDKIDIIHEIKDLLKDLFPDQRNSFKYTFLMIKLDKYNGDLSKLVNSEGGINTDEEFKEKQLILDNLMKVITYYIPMMLKEEAFFSEVFY